MGKKKKSETRKPLSKKIRFEVFKRDSFTCQYCGRMAPDVVLEVDHINPVKNGGDNDLLNLVTSCFDCNRGKGSKQLSDRQVVKQQQEQLKELNERREQLEMMLKWKKELSKLDDQQIDIIQEIFQDGTGRIFTDSGRDSIRKAIEKYGLSNVIDATHISLRQYYIDDEEKSIVKTFDYIPRIAHNLFNRKKDPYIKDKNYIKAIMRNRGFLHNELRVMKALNELCVDDDFAYTIKQIAKIARNWTVFWEELNITFDSNY